MTKSKPTVYTFGSTYIEANKLISLLQSLAINCIVDCRSDSGTEELKIQLKHNNIAYLSFFEHFGTIKTNTKPQNEEKMYEKVIQTDHFLRGIIRLQNGIEKGYRICIIDNEPDTTKSKRFLLIGRYLTESVNTIHINSQHRLISQQQLQRQKELAEAKKKQKKQIAQETGIKGEHLAAAYLTMNGYRILDTNWNLHHGCELDIIALKNQTLHFIEVKTRTTDKYGEPEAAINYKKLQHLYRACQSYRYQNHLNKMDYQLDSISIIYHNGNDYTLRHFLDIRTFNQACAEIITYSPHASK